MADPVSGSTTDPSSSGTSSTGGGWLSDIGNFMQSPTGQLVSSAGTAALGMYQAGQANKQAQAQAGQIQAAGAPAGGLSAGTYGQLAGGAKMGGPAGQIVSGTTGTAQTLLQTAEQYASGQLTPAQQQMVNQYSAGQEAQLTASLGNRADSSARGQGLQAIDNNAAMLAQAMQASNMSIAQGALQSATTAYNSLLSGALSAGQLNLDATKSAVATAIQSDQQISQYIQQLISGVAQGMAGQTGATGTAGAGQAVGGALSKLFKGGGGQVSSGVGAAGQATGYSAATDAAINQSIGQTQAQTAQQISDMPAPDIQITDPSATPTDTMVASTDTSGPP